MGIILFFVSISELLLPSGIQILKDENCRIKEVSVGIELNPSAKINFAGKNFFEKTGYNYFYLKDMDSIATLTRFIKLLSQNKIFSQRNEDGPTNLLRLTLNDINGNSSPIISIIVSITGKISEEKIIDIVNLIPDTLISNSNAYYNLKRVVGKHIYPGKENFIANISPSPFSEDFSVFLVFLKLMNNRNLKVRFSPETAPSPFLIYVSKDKIKSIFTKPQKNEIKRAVQEVSNWIEILSLEKNKSRCLILTHSMGIEKIVLKNWVKEMRGLEDIEVQKAWEKYLTDGFVASLDSSLTERIKKIFPESAINLE
jgi:glutaredoxin-related protein